eukprot:8778450-Pyramimonas_sp.AAC.1
MLMSMAAMIHCFLHAAVLASSHQLGRRAVPEKVSTSKASGPMKPRSTRRNLMARHTSPFPFFTNCHAYTYLEVMMFYALDRSSSLKRP